MKEKIIELLSGEIKGNKEKIKNLVEVPPRQDFGDYSFPCFSVAKEENKNPLEFAKELAESLRKKLPEEITNVSFKGAYVNFFIDKKIFAKKVLSESQKKSFGTFAKKNPKKILIDMSSPNIAKPFGIGHLRSTIIGNAISNIARASGDKTVKINYLGDWGTQFGKVILGYKKWGDEKKLKENPSRHLLELYAKTNSEEYEKQAREEFKKLENGDRENISLWKKFRDISLKEFEKIYRLLGVSFDVVSGESKYNDKMDFVVEKLKEKKLVKKDDGALIVDLKSENLGVALIQKDDGTSLYVTRDIAAAISRKEEYGFDEMVYEVGSEQKLHFSQVFKILELLGYSWAKNLKHVSHGLYLDKDGKKFATRKGKTVFMSEILGEVIEKAKKELSSREDLSDTELDRRARKIAVAAIIYGDLKNYRENNIIFDIDKFLSFEGDTGPYLLYSYARASSIIRKVKSKAKLKIIDFHDVEIKLLKKISDFPEIIKKSYKNLSPNLIANYSFELAQIFNEFYHSCPVLGGIEEAFRLKLVNSFRNTLKKSLALLGIEVLEEM